MKVTKVKRVKKDRPRYQVVSGFEGVFKRAYAKTLGDGLKEVVDMMAKYTKE